MSDSYVSTLARLQYRLRSMHPRNSISSFLGALPSCSLLTHHHGQLQLGAASAGLLARHSLAAAAVSDKVCGITDNILGQIVLASCGSQPKRTRRHPVGSCAATARRECQLGSCSATAAPRLRLCSATRHTHQALFKALASGLGATKEATLTEPLDTKRHRP